MLFKKKHVPELPPFGSIKKYNEMNVIWIHFNLDHRIPLKFIQNIIMKIYEYLWIIMRTKSKLERRSLPQIQMYK